jgi:hypothetical protein
LMTSQSRVSSFTEGAKASNPGQGVSIIVAIKYIHNPGKMYLLLWTNITTTTKCFPHTCNVIRKAFLSTPVVQLLQPGYYSQDYI